MTETDGREDEGAGPVHVAAGRARLRHPHRPVTSVSATAPRGHITGHKCPQCGKVYVPPAGLLPAVRGRDRRGARGGGGATGARHLVHRHHADPVPRPGGARGLRPGHVLLDGADATVGQQRIGEVAIDQVRMGMRVEAVWARGRTRTGPTRAAGLRRRHPGWEADRRARRRPRASTRSTCCERRRHRLVRASRRSTRTPSMTETQMLYPVITEALEGAGIDRRRDRLHVLGQRRLPRRRPFTFVQPRSHRRVAADLRVARRDGRRVGPVRGVGPAPARRRRHRARRSRRASRRGGNLREVLCLQLDPYYLLPLWVDYVSLAALQAQACSTRRAHRARPGRDRGRAAGATRRQPERAGVGRLDRRRSARRGLRRRAAASHDCPPVDRRRRRRRARRGRPGRATCASGRRGSGASTTAPTRTTRASATCDVARRPARGRAGRRRRRRRSRSPSCARCSATRS